jgi:hypothetical protein
MINERGIRHTKAANKRQHDARRDASKDQRFCSQGIDQFEFAKPLPVADSR